MVIGIEIGRAQRSDGGLDALDEGVVAELKNALQDLAYYRWYLQSEQMSQAQYDRSTSSYELALYRIANNMPLFPEGFKGCTIPVNPHAGTGLAEKFLLEKYGLEIPKKQSQLQDFITEELMNCLERTATNCLLKPFAPPSAPKAPSDSRSHCPLGP